MVQGGKEGIQRWALGLVLSHLGGDIRRGAERWEAASQGCAWV